MTAVIARIALRYAAGALIAKGVLDPGTGDTIINDPDLQILAGAGIGVISEGWYVIARKLGWAK